MKPETAIRTTRWKLVLTACGLALLAGCGSGGSSGTTPSAATSSSSASRPPSSSALCADVAALRASLDKLRHVKVAPGVANQVTTDLNEVKTALTTLVTGARGRWQAQTSALSTALDTLNTAAKSLAASPGSSTVSAVVAALGQVNTAAQNLLAAVNTDCPSASETSSA